MTSINTKNYKKYLPKQDNKTKLETKSNTNDFTDQIIVIDGNDPSKVTIRNQAADGSWHTTQVVIQSRNQSIKNNVADELAKLILSKAQADLNQKFGVISLSLSDYKKYPLTGTSSVQELTIGIYSTETDDESALHHLLRNTQDHL